MYIFRGIYARTGPSTKSYEGAPYQSSLHTCMYDYMSTALTEYQDPVHARPATMGRSCGIRKDRCKTLYRGSRECNYLICTIELNVHERRLHPACMTCLFEPKALNGPINGA